MLPDHQVRASDTRMETVYRHFEGNLTDICRVAQNSGIPAIVSTVGVNLKDSAPFSSLHRLGLPEADMRMWEEIVGEGETLQEQGRTREAIERFLQAVEIDPDYAELHFRLARCYWALWKFKEGRAHYAKARDLDTTRVRADTRINEIIRRVAGARPMRGYILSMHCRFSKQTARNRP